MDPEHFLRLLPEGWRPWEEVAVRAGLSLAQVRALAYALRAAGYPVLLAEERGVGLEPGCPAPQFVLPRLRGRLGRPYRYLGTVSSTQEVLRAWAGAPEGALVVAERQTAGRGRLGRAWLSPPGNLYLSLLLRGPPPHLLPLRVGVALAQAAGCGRLKWPNDLLSPDGRKLGGILIEAERHRLLVGVGVNVAKAPLPTAAALQEFRAVRRADLLVEFLGLLEGWLACPAARVLRTWQELDGTLGKEVRVRTPQGVVEGVAEGLTPEGGLRVRTAQGERVIRVGEVGLPPPEDVVDPQEGEGEAQGGGSGEGEGEGPGAAVEEGQHVAHGGVRETREEKEEE
ncbi:MAG: biotin--[acetyl-CoA-carboxylase] ligase [Candidatus Bipolaricaulota bacterium]|nr:biotin--[acetyl-CoA-carboxylase] ligase [Candidatus Bipolaricaulota bacterium]